MDEHERGRRQRGCCAAWEAWVWLLHFLARKRWARKEGNAERSSNPKPRERERHAEPSPGHSRHDLIDLFHPFSSTNTAPLSLLSTTRRQLPLHLPHTAFPIAMPSRLQLWPPISLPWLSMASGVASPCSSPHPLSHGHDDLQPFLGGRRACRGRWP